jgi:hypothetical protein
MRLARRAEIVLDAQVKVQPAGAEPDTPSSRQRSRLGDFRLAEDGDEERSSALLLAARHRQLDVMQPFEQLAPLDVSGRDDPRRVRYR